MSHRLSIVRCCLGDVLVAILLHLKSQPHHCFTALRCIVVVLLCTMVFVRKLVTLVLLLPLAALGFQPSTKPAFAARQSTALEVAPTMVVF